MTAVPHSQASHGFLFLLSTFTYVFFIHIVHRLFHQSWADYLQLQTFISEHTLIFASSDNGGLVG